MRSFRRSFVRAASVGTLVAVAISVAGQEKKSALDPPNKPAANKSAANASSPAADPPRSSGESRSPNDRAAKPPSAATINYLDPYEAMAKGGPLMWPILFCSVLTFALGLERMVSLRRRRAIPLAFARRLLEQVRLGRVDQRTAMELCRTNGSPIAEIFFNALRYWGRPPAEIDRAIADAGEREAALLRRNLRALQGTGNISTLLGLLGTIVGMIQAFNNVAAERGLGRAEVLAGGIAQALLTTAFGLVVAIPAFFLHTYFAGRVERLVHEMDEEATALADLIGGDPGDGSSGSRPPGASAAPKVAPRYVS